MPWVRVDDSFYDHGRFEEVSMEAIGLWVIGLAWSNRNLKDGRIPKAKVRSLHADSRPKIVRQLVSAGLWVDDGNFFEIRDYLDYQKDAETITREREAARIRKARSRARQHNTETFPEAVPPEGMFRSA